MKLNTDFAQLPLRFDVNRLCHEINQFREGDWSTKFSGFSGNQAIILVSAGGTINDDFAISAPMKPTEFLDGCPYLKQVMAALEVPISRSYLIRISGGSKTTPKADANYHWFRRVGIYIPIVTHPQLELSCNGKSIQIGAGEAWIFDNSQPYCLGNETETDSIYLVVETKGYSAGLDILSKEEKNGESLGSGKSDSVNYQIEYPLRDRAAGTQCDRNSAKLEFQYLPFFPDSLCQIPLESYSFEVLTPLEIDRLTMDILADVRDAGMAEEQIYKLADNLKDFFNQWAEVFAKFGHHNTGELAYRNLIVDFKAKIAILARKWLSEKGKYAVNIITSMLLTAPVAKHFPQSLLAARAKPQPQATPQPENFQLPEFEKPIFIVSAPRAGSTLLFETLSQFPDIWTIGDESHEIIEGIPQLHPAARNFTSNRLTQADAIPEISSILHQRFVRELQNRDGNQYLSLTELEAPKQIRFLEKTPKNALRIPFLKAVFPDALFIYLYREARENISSLIEGWRTEKFLAYSQLPGWAYRDWRFLLPPGWLSLQSSSIPEIAAYQWQAANSYILSDLQALPPSDWFFVSYLDLVKQPEKTIKAIRDFAGLDWDENIKAIVSNPLAIAKRNISTPSPDKWRKYEHEISPLLSNLEPIISKVEKISELLRVNC